MSKTAEYINQLSALKEGERSQLRRLAGQPLDSSLQGFDLFAGIWWPLRNSSPKAPRREPSWLVAKLFCTFHLPHIGSTSEVEHSLPQVLRRCEPKSNAKEKSEAQKRFRSRFDALLCSPLSTLEPHLRWALAEVDKAAKGHVPHAKGVQGIDWVRLLDDLSIWDRGQQHQRGRDVRELWAEAYLNNSPSL